MMGCLNEGALQAYLDGELPEANMYHAAGHLQSCAECRAGLERVGTTAARVSALLDSLVVVAPAAAPSAVSQLCARPAIPRVRWAAVAALGALAISAALLVAMARRPPEPARQRIATQELQELKPQAEPAVVVRTVPVAAKPRAARVRRPKPLPVPADFLALDNANPIQVGMVVRVVLPASAFAAASQAGDVQAVMADLVIGEDGRARAIRFVQ